MFIACPMQIGNKCELDGRAGEVEATVRRFIPADTLLSGNPNVKDIKEHVVLTAITFQKGHLSPYV